jgi:hypothetical protein
LLFVVCTFFNDTFTVAVWTSFHTSLMLVSPSLAATHQRPTSRGEDLSGDASLAASTEPSWRPLPNHCAQPLAKSPRTE